MTATVYTVGHGSRSASEFREVLQHAGVGQLVDVRAHPGSRRHPHFSRPLLDADLEAAGIAYRWEGAALGGRRRSRSGSRHVAWRNESFRAYADHMESEAFSAAIDALIERAAGESTAIMCAERLPWQCHRYLISDYLIMRGLRIIHLIARGSARPHVLNPMARVERGQLVYDRAGDPDLL